LKKNELIFFLIQHTSCFPPWKIDLFFNSTTFVEDYTAFIYQLQTEAKYT
jgi:hypothetical protein